MNVYLFKKDSLYNLSLPLRVKGQYWLHDHDDNGKERKVISIEELNGKWVLKSNKKVFLLDENNRKQKIAEIVGKCFYSAYLPEEDEYILIYAEDSLDGNEKYQKYVVNDRTSLYIGRSDDNDISFKNKMVSSKHTQIAYQGEKWLVKDLSSSNGTYLNDRRITTAIAEYGDVLFIMGLKIVLGHGFFAINNPGSNVSINNVSLEPFITPVFEKDIRELSDESDFENETEFFYRTPRFKRNIETAKFKIDTPPNDQVGDELPVALVIGPSLTMGLASMTTGIFAINNAMQTGNITGAIPSVVMSFSMLLGTVLWPILSKQYDKKRKHRKEEKRQKKYTEYLSHTNEMITAEGEKQAAILHENHLSIEECLKIIKTKALPLWERGFGQDDFLKLRIGKGSINLDAELLYAERKFTLDDDNLQEEMLKLGESEKLINDVPITVSLFEEYITGIVADRNTLRAFGKGLIMQIAALYGYDEIKMCFLLGNDYTEMSFVKWLPHTWNEDHLVRFVASNVSEAKEISSYFTRIVEARESLNDNEIEDQQPYYIIFCFDKELADRTEVIRKICSLKKNIHISVVSLYDEFKDLPKECSTVIEIKEKNGLIYNKKNISGERKEFTPDILLDGNIDEYSIELANINLDIQGAGFNLPDMITFLQMFEVGKIEYLNVLNRWNENDPTKSLQTEVGINTLGDKFMLDLHEKYHGPHGLVAGMTGSGKSEFIMTYILSLAVNYHPDEVAFILIDYKGGGMAKVFEKLPHTAGIITNLDGAEIKRALISIESELKRRQKIFSETGSRLGTSNIDIYNYQRLYREGVAKEPLQHLFIISDEFAELKAQQPEFMQQLISTARIGRSLGVHLILATQKPAGVVDDQIWSNSKFKICLKVQERADSMDMLKRPDAAELTKTGRFYLQVGYNELFEMGQSAWSGAFYKPSERSVKELDDSISIINNNGSVIKRIRMERDSSRQRQRKQIDEIVKYLKEIADEEKIKVRPLWLEPISPDIMQDDIERKYNKSITRGLCPTIGEYDDPYNQKQNLFKLPISEKGNAAIFGMAGSGKTALLNGLIYSLLKEKTPDELNLYILDFYAETMWMFEKAPQVGEVLFSHDGERIESLFKDMYKEIRSRKKKFAAYGGSLEEYVSETGETVPNILIIINNYAVFSELYENREEDVLFLSREGAKYGINFIITAALPNNVRFRILQNFTQQLTLQMADESEYSAIVGKTEGVIPSKYEGRGLVHLDRVYEFQTAKIVKDGNPKEYIREFCEMLDKKWTGKKAKRVPVMPDEVNTKLFKERFGNIVSKDLRKIPVGIDSDKLEPVFYDFEKKYITCVLSQGTEYKSFSEELRKLISKEGSAMTLKVMEKNNIAELFDEVLFRNNTYKTAISDGKEIPKFNKLLVFIEGLSEVRTVLSQEEAEKLKLILEKGKLEYNMFIIVCDSSNKFSTEVYEKWYKANVDQQSGIWVGNGFSEQYCMKLTTSLSRYSAELKNGFGYVLKQGNAIKAKLLHEAEVEHE